MGNKGLSVVIRNEHQFNRIKSFLGEDCLYLNYVPQMSEVETGIVIHYYDEGDEPDEPSLSPGSVGSSKYQEELGCRLVEFESYFN